ncbi:hypothetical protein [Nitrolancea hollandica]|uniref:Uncharacterized protein n=1 Tax=Nitrolancea hollandica Lb TaxID=1129897 RepID=I4EFY7_9BACT|nr:hypothetical protein [Nitrolancea hollandica]CCF83599.1 hypothetical protein NITHO_2500006 [Nitrolancea hollandica Lb]
MAGLARRLEALERTIQPAAEPSLDYYDASIVAWDELLQTMSPEHVEIIRDDLMTDGHAALDWHGHLTATRQALHLTRIMSHMTFLRARGQYRARYALPAAIAEVYLDHPEATPLHACWECGLYIPIRPGLTQPYRPVIKFFDSCPECGGRVAYGHPQERIESPRTRD